MARKADSGIYQVDLVAALFGGFMIAWLSSAEEVEFPGAGAEPPVYVTLEGFVSVPAPTLVKEPIIWYQANDIAAARTNCLSPSELDHMGLGQIKRLPCPSRVSTIPSSTAESVPSGGGFYHELYLAQALEAPWNEPCFKSGGSNQRLDRFTHSIALAFDSTSWGVPVGLALYDAHDTVETEAPGTFGLGYALHRTLSPNHSNNPSCATKFTQSELVPVYALSEKLDIFSMAEVDVRIRSDNFQRLNLVHMKDGAVGKYISRPYPLAELPDDGTSAASKAAGTPPKKIEIAVRLCAYRDGRQVCFVGKNDLSQGKVQLNRQK